MVGDDHEDEDDSLSTANVNCTVVKDERLYQFADHERMVLLKGVSEPRDLVVMTNRICDKYGNVTGSRTVTTGTATTGGVTIIYCDNR